MWLKFMAHYEESAGNRGCQFSFDFGYVYFSAQFVDGHLAKAGFGRFDFYVSDDEDHKFWLTPDEMRGLEFFRDQSGRIWLKKMALSSRLAAWLIRAVNYDANLCQLDDITSLLPAMVELNFELKGFLTVFCSAIRNHSHFRDDGRNERQFR